MVRVTSVSQSRELAQKTLNQFIEAMRIDEGPPPTMPAKTLPSGAQEL